MICIKTEYKGHTDHHGARIVASTDTVRIVVHYAHEISAEENHKRAAYLLSEKLGMHDAQVCKHHNGSYKGAQYHLFVRQEV